MGKESEDIWVLYKYSLKNNLIVGGFNNQINRMTNFVNADQLLQPKTPVIAQ